MKKFRLIKSVKLVMRQSKTKRSSFMKTVRKSWKIKSRFHFLEFQIIFSMVQMAWETLLSQSDHRKERISSWRKLGRQRIKTKILGLIHSIEKAMILELQKVIQRRQVWIQNLQNLWKWIRLNRCILPIIIQNVILNNIN